MRQAVTLTDAFLVTLETEYDTMTSTLTAENLQLPAFGSTSPSALHIEGYCEGYGEYGAQIAEQCIPGV